MQKDVGQFLYDYNSTAEEQLFKYVEADWNYNTNITPETQAYSVRTTSRLQINKLTHEF